MKGLIFTIIILILFPAVSASCAGNVVEAADKSPAAFEGIRNSEETAEADETLLTVEYVPSVTDCELIAQVLYHECRYLPKLEQSAVVWTILNRVDSEFAYFPNTVEEVCKQKIGKTSMFAYDPDAPVEENLFNLAKDVMIRWHREKAGEENVGRTLPKEYVYFWGNGHHNFFRIEYQGQEYWDWSLPDPYTEEEP